MSYTSFNFDHAVVHKKGGSSSTVTTGDIILGYKAESFDENDWIELYFKIPDSSNIYSKFWKGASIVTIGERTLYSCMRGIAGGWNTYDLSNYYVDTSDVRTGSKANNCGYIRNGIDRFSRIDIGIYDNNIAYEQQHPTTDRMIVVRINSYSPAPDIYNGVVLSRIEQSYISIDWEECQVRIEPVSPVDATIKNTDENVFVFNASKNRQVAPYSVISTDLLVNVNGSEKSFSLPGLQNTFVIPAETFEIGNAWYELSATDNSGTVWKSKRVNITISGSSSAPTITSISQNSMPTVNWVSVQQDAWQMIVKNSGDVIYDSKMVSGNAQQFTLPIMLEDGAYSFEMRILNKFGFYTDWSTFGVIINTQKPSAAEDIFVSVTNDYGVTIDCSVPDDAGTLYVVRRVSGTNDIEVIGEYFKGFTDYRIPINSTYEYTIRNHNIGYSDGEWIDATVRAYGIVIRDGDNIEKALNLWKVEDGEFELLSNDFRKKELLNCVGRTYPVVESSEWVDSTRSVQVFIDNALYKSLKKMEVDSLFVYLQSSAEFIPCAISVAENSSYMNNGIFATISFVRIDEV